MKSNSRFSHRQQKQKQKLIISYFVGSALISIVTLFIVLGSNLQFRKNLSQNLSQIIIAGIPLPIYLDVMTDAEAAFAFLSHRITSNPSINQMVIVTRMGNYR